MEQSRLNKAFPSERREQKWTTLNSHIVIVKMVAFVFLKKYPQLCGKCLRCGPGISFHLSLILILLIIDI